MGTEEYNKSRIEDVEFILQLMRKDFEEQQKSFERRYKLIASMLTNLKEKTI